MAFFKNLWDAAKEVLRGKFMAWKNIYPIFHIQHIFHQERSFSLSPPLSSCYVVMDIKLEIDYWKEWGTKEQEAGNTKGHKETLQDDRYIHYCNCSEFMSSYIYINILSKFITLYTLEEYNILYVHLPQ